MPSTDGILGHRAVFEGLEAAVARDGLHHAYLFEGPAGLGKRKVADWLVRRANCIGDGPPPCGCCPQCVRIAAGTHPDVIELAPDPGRVSRTIGVDAVREVIRKASYHRFDSKRRFILVDPADAMAEPAANALLKILEEPPAGTGFVLLATSSRHLLPTIVSRCQRVRFGAVPTELITTWLESRGVQDAAACAALALGCPGRALELAEGGLAARRDARSTVVRVATSTLGATVDHGEALTRKRGKGDWIGEASLELEILEELLRDVVAHGTGSGLPLLHADVPELIADWSDRLYPGGVTRVAAALQDARDQLEVNVTGRLVLEALFSRLRAELGAG